MRDQNLAPEFIIRVQVKDSKFITLDQGYRSEPRTQSLRSGSIARNPAQKSEIKAQSLDIISIF